MERLNSTGIQEVSSGARRHPPVSVRDEGGKDLEGWQNNVCKSYRGVGERGFPQETANCGRESRVAQDGSAHMWEEGARQRKGGARALILTEHLFCPRLFPSGISHEDFNDLLTWFITPLCQ